MSIEEIYSLQKDWQNTGMVNEIHKEDYQFMISIWQRAMPPAHPHICKGQWGFIFPSFFQELKNAEVGYTYKENNVIVGFIFGLKRDTDGCYIQELCIDPVCQRKGIGRKLLNQMKDNFKYLWLHVYMQNAGGIEVYKKAMFKEREFKICPITGYPKVLMAWQR